MGTQRIGLEAVLITKQFEKGLRIYQTGLNQAETTTKQFAKSTGVARSALLGFGAVVGTAAVAGIKAVVKEGAAFQKTMSNVAALTGAIGKDFSSLEQTAKNLGKTTAFTAVEAGEGMAFLAQAGFETDEIISALPGTLNLASAANLDLATSADIVSNILQGFGATAESTGQFVDILTATFTTSNTNLVQLGQAMKFVAPVASGLGITVQETAAAIGVLGNAGIQGALAGTTLRGALLTLASPSKKAATVMNELGIEIFNASGEMLSLPEIVGNVNAALVGLTEEQQVVALKTLVGTRRLAGFQVLLKAGQTDLENYTESLNQTGVASEIASTQLNNLAGDFTILQSAISGLAITIFDELEPSLRSLTRTSTDIVSSFDFLITVLSNLDAQSRNAQTSTSLFTQTIDQNRRAAEQILTGWATVGVELGKLIVGEDALTSAVVAATGALEEEAGASDSLANSTGLASTEVDKLTKANSKLAKSAGLAASAQISLAKSGFFGTDAQGKLAARVFQSSDAIGAQTSRLTELAQAMGIATGEATIFQSEQENIQQGLDVTSERLAGLASAYGSFGALAGTGEADFTRTVPDDLRVDVEVDTEAISSTIKDGLDEVKRAIGEVSGLTFEQHLPVEETFRVDEWVSRLIAVATDGKNEWVDDLQTQFGGQEFFAPMADAIASGDPSQIQAAAQQILNGDSLLQLMDIEGAVAELEGLLAEQELQQSVNDAILAAFLEGGGQLPADGGVGGQAIANALGLGPGTDVETPITEAVTGLDIPGIISNALVTNDETSPLLTALGLGPDGLFTTAVETLTGETLPAIGDAFLMLAQNSTTAFNDELLIAIQNVDQALMTMSNSTLLTLKGSFASTTITALTGLSAVLKKIKEVDDGIQDLGKSLGRLVPRINSAARAATELARALERAAAARGALRGTPSSFGFRTGVGFQQGTSPLGFRVPAGFPNDTFPINVTSGERVIVSPPGKSIEQVTRGVGDVSVTFTGPINIANQSDLNMFANRVSRQVTQQLN